MIGANLDFSDLLNLAEDLAVLSKAETKRVLNQAARAGAEVIRDAVAEGAPKRTGKLARNIVVVSRKSGPGKRWPVFIFAVPIPTERTAITQPRVPAVITPFTGASSSWAHQRCPRILSFALPTIPIRNWRLRPGLMS